MILATTLAAIASSVTALTCSAPATAGADALPYADLAETFLESMGRNPEAPRQFATPESILADKFLLTSVGLFDVWIPAQDLADKSTSKDYRDICIALCNTQAEWLAWLGKGANDAETIAQALEEQGEWIEDWKLSDLMEAAESDSRNSLDLFDAKEEIRQISHSLSQTFREASILGEARSDGKPVKLVLMPERKSFVEFITYAGWYLPNCRGIFWAEGISSWSQFSLNDLLVIALEYASPSARPGDYSQSYSMKAKSPTGMEEQVAQLALNKLLAYEHGEALPPSLVSGLSINLITKIYGACHTRIDGDTRGKVTQKREVFVRGGQSEGGVLPPNSAESRWRSLYGKKYYTSILKQVQKSGAGADKRSHNKYNSFLLVSDNGSRSYVTHAPLLGPSAGEQEVVPDAIYGDFLEFTRAYRSAFLYWLQHHGERSKKKSASSFSDFLSRISGSADISISSIAFEVYGKPLSDPEASKKSLEGNFLKWLSRQ